MYCKRNDNCDLHLQSVFAVALFIGLILGWCAIPQPKWAQPLWDKFAKLMKGVVKSVNKGSNNPPDDDDDKKFKA